MTARATAERPPWLVRVRRERDGEPVGGGMLCDERHVVTCAHVVCADQPSERPQEPVFVDFQFLDPHEPLPAHVIEGGWHPAVDRTADIAVLELAGPVPEGATAAPLRATTSGVIKHTFTAYGYPERHARHGTSALGDIVGRAEAEGWLRLQAETSYGQALEKGFSGSPVWDDTEPGVIGIVITRALPGRDKVDPRTAFAIPVEVLAKYWPPLVELIRDAVPADPEAERRRLEELLYVPLDDGELPRVLGVDIYRVGVTKSKYVTRERPEPPYVPRARVDRELDAALAGERFILAKGDSTAGKSRTLIELLRRRMPDAPLIVPMPDPAALRALTRLTLPLGGVPAVLWLDELDRFLGPKGIDVKVLDHFEQHEPPITIVASITSRRHGDVLDADRETKTAVRVFERAYTVRIPNVLAAEDRAQAQRDYPDDVTARGFGEQLVAAPALEDCYENAHERKPAGWAVIRAAVDWGRIGLDAPVPEGVLRELFAQYHLDEYGRVPDSGDFEAGLSWSQRAVAGNIAPVTQVTAGEEPSYVAFEYLRAYLDGQATGNAVAIPAFTWEHATESLAPDALLNLSYAAITRSERGAAKAALKRASGAEDDQQSAAWAGLLLGELELGEDIEAAAEALERAADSGIADVVPLAQVDLANVAMISGEFGRAVELLESALASGHPEAAPLAQVTLGGVLGGMGDVERALELLESALESDDPEVAPMAQARISDLVTAGGRRADKSALRPAAAGDASGAPAATAAPQGASLFGALRASAVAQVVPFAQLNLGRLLATQGQLDKARGLIEQSMSSENPNVKPVAQANMAALLADEGDWDGAETLLEEAIASLHPFAAPLATVSLGALRLMRGEFDHARELLASVVASGPWDQATRASDILGDVFAAAGDAAGARAAYEHAIAAGHPDWTPVAQVDLAVLVANEGDFARARELLEAAEASRHIHQSARAADMLGDLLVAAGDVHGAADAYRRAIDSRHPNWAPIARIDLAILLSDDVPEQSRRLLEEVARSDHPHLGPCAIGVLGELLASQGDADGANACYKRAVAVGHPEISPMAQVNLAVLRGDAGDLDGAAELLVDATGAANPITAAQARLFLGVVRAEQRDQAAARAEFERAASSNVPQVVPFAQYQLAKLDALENDFAAAAERLTALSEADETAAPGVRRIARSYLEFVRLREGEPDGGEVASAALVRHAEQLFEAGEIAEAEEALNAILELPGSAAPPRTYAVLGLVALAQGDLDGAQRWFNEALGTGDAEVEPLVRRYLGSVLAQQGHEDKAREMLLPLERSTDMTHRPAALVLLGRLAVLDRDVEAALRFFEAAAASGDEIAAADARRALDELPAAPRAEVVAEFEPARPEPGEALPPLVMALVGEVALAEGAVSEAREWLEQAVSSGDPAAGERASAVLAVVAENAGPEVEPS